MRTRSPLTSSPLSPSNTSERMPNSVLYVSTTSPSTYTRETATYKVGVCDVHGPQSRGFCTTADPFTSPIAPAANTTLPRSTSATFLPTAPVSPSSTYNPVSTPTSTLPPLT